MSAEPAVTETSTRRRRYTPEPVRKRFSADKRHAQLLDVARQIIDKQGAPGLTIERLATTAGVSRGLAYHHFANATEVIMELLEEEFDWLEERISERLNDAVTFEDKIRAVTRPYLDAKRERTAVFNALMLGVPSNADVLAAVSAHRMDTLRYWMDEVVDTYDLDPRVARSALVILVPGWRTTAERYWSVDYLKADSVIELFVIVVTSALNGLVKRGAATLDLADGQLGT